MRVHASEKPYNCHLCTKPFSWSGDLQMHTKNPEVSSLYKIIYNVGSDCYCGYINLTYRIMFICYILNCNCSLLIVGEYANSI
jgi:hypothetical protein